MGSRCWGYIGKRRWGEDMLQENTLDGERGNRVAGLLGQVAGAGRTLVLEDRSTGPCWIISYQLWEAEVIAAMVTATFISVSSFFQNSFSFLDLPCSELSNLGYYHLPLSNHWKGNRTMAKQSLGRIPTLPSPHFLDLFLNALTKSIKMHGTKTLPPRWHVHLLRSLFIYSFHPKFKQFQLYARQCTGIQSLWFQITYFLNYTK